MNGILLYFQLNGEDLRDASHDVAVEAIRNSSSPMEFVVERLVEQVLLSPSKVKCSVICISSGMVLSKCSNKALFYQLW